MSFRRILLTISVVVIVFLLLLYLLGARLNLTSHYIDRDEITAVHKLAELHSNYNSREFQKIYDSYSSVFKNQVPAASAISGIQAAFSQLGRFQAVLDCRINTVMAAQPQVRIVANVQFANDVRTEQVVFLEEADQINLLNYSLSKGPANLPDNMQKCPE